MKLFILVGKKLGIIKASNKYIRRPQSLTVTLGPTIYTVQEFEYA